MISSLYKQSTDIIPEFIWTCVETGLYDFVNLIGLSGFYLQYNTHIERIIIQECI